MSDKYVLEEIREFLMKRPFLVGDDETYLVTQAEYEALKRREDVRMGREREDYIRAFADGWIAARG